MKQVVRAAPVTPDAQTITEAVRARYGAIASEVLADQAGSGCCDSATCCGGESAGDTISQGLYAVDELEELPLKAALASLGCGNPTASRSICANSWGRGLASTACAARSTP